MELAYFMVLYMVLTMMFFGFNSLVMLWVLMELNLIVFVMIIMNLFSNSIEFYMEQSFFYLIVQTIGSILFLLGMALTDFFKFLYLDSNLLILFSLILKLGLFPLHQWMYHLSAHVSNITLLILLTIQKIPLLFVFFSFNMNSVVLVSLINLLFGSFMVMKSSLIKEILVSSSIYSTIWFMLFFFLSPIFFLMFILNYSIFIYKLINFDSLAFSGGVTSFNLILLTFSILFLVGLPPFGMFFFKFFSMGILSSLFTKLFLSLLWIGTLISTIGYFSFFLNFFFINYNLYEFYNTNIIEIGSLVLIFSLFLYF